MGYPKKCEKCPYRVLGFCTRLNKNCRDNCDLKVYVIGSMSCAERIKEIAEEYKECGHSVKYVYPRPEERLDDLIMECYRNISGANLIVAVAKEDGTYGTGTLYEIGFAQFLSKPIVRLRGDKNEIS